MQCELKIKNRSPFTALIAFLVMLVVLFFVISLKGNKKESESNKHQEPTEVIKGY